MIASPSSYQEGVLFSKAHGINLPYARYGTSFVYPDTSHTAPPVIPKYSYATKFAKAAKRKNLEEAGVKIVIKPSPHSPSRPNSAYPHAGRQVKSSGITKPVSKQMASASVMSNLRRRPQTARVKSRRHHQDIPARLYSQYHNHDLGPGNSWCPSKSTGGRHGALKNSNSNSSIQHTSSAYSAPRPHSSNPVTRANRNMHQQYRRNFDHTSNSAHSTDHAVQNDKGMGRENKNPRDLGNTSHTGGKSAKFQHRVSQEMRIRQLEHQCFELSRVLRLSETQHSELQSSATDLQREHSNLLFKHSLAKNGAIDQAQLKATIARQMESHAGEIASLERDLQQGKTQMTALITTQVETEGLLRETTAKFEREQSLNERLALRNRALEKELSSLKSTHVDESEFIKRLEHELKTCQRAHESCPALVHEIDELTQRLKDAGEQKLVDSVRISDLEGEIGENRKEIHKMTLTIEQLQDELETAIESHAGCAAQTKQLNEMRTDFNNSQKKLQELNSELEIKSSQLMDIINTHETVIQQNKQSSHKHEMMEQMIKKLMDYKESDSKQKQFKINTIRRAKRLMNELEADIGASYTKNPKGGLLINKVPKSSEAYRGGLRRGDQVVQLQGREVSSKKECLDLIKQYAIGDSICFQIMQGSEKEKICFVKVGAVGISSHDALQRLRRLAERDDQDFQLNISELEKMKSHSRKGKTGKTKHSSKSESKRAQSVSMMNHIDNPM